MVIEFMVTFKIKLNFYFHFSRVYAFALSSPKLIKGSFFSGKANSFQICILHSKYYIHKAQKPRLWAGISQVDRVSKSENII